MSNQRQQNITTYPIAFFVTLSIDHTTGATGKTLTVTLSKNGAGLGAAAGGATEIGSGWYSIAHATDFNTLGQLLIHATGTGCDPYDGAFEIVGYDPFIATRPVNVTQWNGTAVATPAAAGYPVVTLKSGTGTGEVNLTGGVANSNLVQWNGSAPSSLVSGRVDAYGGAMAVGVITAATFAANALDAAWSTATRALTDKVGFSLSAAGVQAVWDALTSALTTVGSIGKRLADNVDAPISTSGASVSTIWNYLTSSITTTGSIGKFLLDKVGLIGSSAATVATPQVTPGHIELYAGDTYSSATANHILTIVGNSAWVSTAPTTLKLYIRHRDESTNLLSPDGTFVDAADDYVTVPLTAAQTTTLTDPGVKAYTYQLVATYADLSVRTLAEGTLTANPKNWS